MDLQKKKEMQKKNPQAITQGMMQAATEAPKSAVQAMSEAAGPAERNETPIAEGMSARTSQPSVKQLSFNWKAKDKYNKLLNYEMEEKMIFLTKSYTFNDSDRVPVTMYWLGCEGQFANLVLSEQ